MMTHHRGRISLRLLIMTTCAILLPHAPRVAAAPAEGWRATAVQGQATVRRGETEPQALVEGRVLEPGESMATAAEGNVVLTRGTSTITVGPNGRMEIPAGGDEGVRTRIVQAMGSLLFKVEKRASQHFEVETPYLAAVVKGTTFSVSVDGEASAVHVVDGAVEVKALATGQVGLIKPGYTAVVSQRRAGDCRSSAASRTPPARPPRARMRTSRWTRPSPRIGRRRPPGRRCAGPGEAAARRARRSHRRCRRDQQGLRPERELRQRQWWRRRTTASLGSAEGKSVANGVGKEKSTTARLPPAPAPPRPQGWQPRRREGVRPRQGAPRSPRLPRPWPAGSPRATRQPQAARRTGEGAGEGAEGQAQDRRWRRRRRR